MHVIEMLLIFPARTQSLTEKKQQHQIKIFTHLSVCVGERDAEVGHGPQDGHEGLDGVAVDHRTVLFEVLGRESTLVNNSGRECQFHKLLGTLTVNLVEKPRMNGCTSQ